MTEELPLITKHRPKILGDIFGNKELINSLQASIDDNNVPTAILLYGPSGCGKTTLARILCSEIGASGQDVKELNISNTRGIDAAREIIKNVTRSSFNGGRKVIVLNEFHSSTKDFQNCILEVLEEPPRKTHFILCTTEPEKLLKTIRTRCTEYRVSELGKRDAIKYIKHIIECEGNEFFTEESIDKIATMSQGSPRQILSIMSKVINLKSKKKVLATIEKFTVDESVVIDLCRVLLERKKWKDISTILKSINEEPETVRRAVLGYMTAVLLNSGNPVAALCIDTFKENYFSSGMAGLVMNCFEFINE